MIENLLNSPTITYCEKALGSFIERPYYAFSNLAYLLCGFLILKRGQGSKISKAFGFTAILCGLLSFIYDSTFTYVSQLFDLLGMLIFVSLLLYLNLSKLLNISRQKLLIIIGDLVFIGMLLIFVFKGFTGNIVFGLFVLSVIISEFLLFKKKLHHSHSFWIKGFAIFIIGFGFWILDVSKIYCDPSNLLNGRGIFHYFTSITIYFLYRFYEANSNKSTP